VVDPSGFATSGMTSEWVSRYNEQRPHEALGDVSSRRYLLQDQLFKLAALVDHYYAAYRETSALLERRDRQLAELRRKLGRAPALLRR
jgi:transposase InsO family protein